MSSRDDEDLAVLLADLEATLTELQSAIDDDVRSRRRPPTPGEILRFTEEYTLPTIIALLEATVRSLELLRAVLRLAGPGRTDDRLRERLASQRDPETVTFRDALTDLREALSGADLPEDSAASSILADARELTEEIDDRLDGRSTDRSRAERDGVGIEVEEQDSVDVDAELSSIKESIEDKEEDDDPAA